MHPNVWIIAVGLSSIVAVANSASVKQAVALKDDYKCTNSGTYVTYDPNSCTYYYECNNGQAERKECGWFYRFDEKQNKCIFHMWLFGFPDCTRSSPVPPTAGPTSSPSSGTGSPSNGTKAPPTKKNAANINSVSVSLGLFFLGALCFLS